MLRHRLSKVAASSPYSYRKLNGANWSHAAEVEAGTPYHAGLTKNIYEETPASNFWVNLNELVWVTCRFTIGSR